MPALACKKILKMLKGVPSSLNRLFADFDAARVEVHEVVSRKVFTKSVFKSQFPHRFVNVFSILVIVKPKMTDVW